LSGDTFLDAGGARLEARFVGRSPAGEPTLVFLHEGLGSAARWKDFPDRVCERVGLGALVYSRRGYGASDGVPPVARPARYMHDEAHEVLPAVLDAAKLDSVILVGHSDGASIALLFAAEDAGARTRAVVAMAPHLFVEEVAVKSITAIRESWAETDLRERLAKYHGANVDGAFLGWNGAWLSPEFREWNIEREVARIAVPVLAIQGEDDEYGTLAQVEAVKRLAKGRVDVRVLAECGHAPWRDRPEETIDAIAELVERLREAP
jgi:pimeloyl-ACP methyl ester carboxylesterase